MNANIENITYIQDQAQFHIITEFSQLPIESFNTESEAQEFIAGYNNNRIDTPAAIKGELFRNFVDIDLKSGIEYRKVRNLIEKISA